jgi:hypothetical protein
VPPTDQSLLPLFLWGVALAVVKDNRFEAHLAISKDEEDQRYLLLPLATASCFCIDRLSSFCDRICNHPRTRMEQGSYRS